MLHAYCTVFGVLGVVELTLKWFYYNSVFEYSRMHKIYIYKMIKDVHVGTTLAAETAWMGDHLKTHGVIGNITTCD